MPSKAVSSALLAWLLLVHSCLLPSALGEDKCWVLDRDHYYYCWKTSKCRAACLEDHYVDGRCKWGFPYLLPVCQCLSLGLGCSHKKKPVPSPPGSPRHSSRRVVEN
ncbi:hypothetical protein EJB05_35977, partial [Eragrostis curvula]